MSTLHELRATLEEHAESIHDTEHVTRAASVHRRVRVVRRRRVAVVSAAAAVVVVAAVAVAGRLSADPEPVPAEQWHGVEVPAEVELAAGTYTLDEVRAVDAGGAESLPYPDHRFALALVASGLGDGSATLLVNGFQVARVADGGEVSPATELFQLYGQKVNDLTVDLDGAPADAEVGFALYRGPDTTFKQRMKDSELAGEASTDEETAFAELTVRAALDDVTVMPNCHSDSGSVSVYTDGELTDPGMPCAQYHQGADGSRISQGGMSAGSGDEVESHTIRVERTGGDPGVSFGLYVLGERRDVLGHQVPETFEHLGRTWVLDEVIEDDGSGSVSTTVDTDGGDRLVDFVSTEHDQERIIEQDEYSQVSITSRLGQDCETLLNDGTLVNAGCGSVLFAGDTYDIQVTSTAGFPAAVLVYRPE